MIEDWTKNQQRGFILKLIIFIIAIALVLGYFHISVQQAVNWILDFIQGIQKLFHVNS